MPFRPLPLLFALFALSGFTGLIYESVWSHYLKLFLGAAAFAQSFVLAMFMGGMALGAWIASRASKRISNLLAAYGLIEGFIGLAALVFHALFVWITGASLDHVIPALGSPGAVEIYKYALCGVLILPQTVLLGMTFPLMSGAVIRRSPEASGHHLAMLYFTNSIGAAGGALMATFFLLGWIGMPGTMRAAGVLNLLLAIAVLVLAQAGEPAPAATQRADASSTNNRVIRLFLVAAFVTGIASFIYEIAWIRMLSLVMGSSFHAFELMLSAFITGLALGGWWIRRRIDEIADPVRFSGFVQVFMGLAALATVIVYHHTFDWMAAALRVLQHNDEAYPLFNLFCHALAFSVMLPATFFAGMTLPLFTHVLLRNGHGERAIGQIYAANTLGAIAGVLLAVHMLVPGAGVKLALVVGAAVDILLGTWLLRYSQSKLRRAYAFSALIIGMLAAAVTARANMLDPARLSSGVFRNGGSLNDPVEVLFYRDGKTASVAVRRYPSGIVTLATNGKPDAGMQMKPDVAHSGDDESTMVMLGALPLLVKPDAKNIANIGFGSGMTAEVLLSHRGPRTLDTIEIEPAIVDGARSFHPRVVRPFEDPRSSIVLEDAKSFFSRHGKRYDVIVSEPSNPWVSGVAGLFTTEFYRDVRRYLAPGGVLVQWLHAYEFNDRLMGSILAALGENFSDYEIYASNSVDLVVVAVVEGRVPRPGPLPAAETAFMEKIARLGIRKPEDVSALSIGTKRDIARLFAVFGAPVNSDYRPMVQLEAPRARFKGEGALGIFSLASANLPILEMLGDTRTTYLRDPGLATTMPTVRLKAQAAALEFARGLEDRSADPLASAETSVYAPLLALKRPGALCGAAVSRMTVEQLHRAAELTLAHLSPDMLRALWIERRWLDCASGKLSQTVSQHLDLYAAIAARDPRAMLARARSLLQQGPGTGDQSWGRYLLTTAMLGARAAGDDGEVQRLWRTYGPALYRGGKIPPSVLFVANTQ
jgi:predicted membrane-bound spermidine synthase